jgi:hypothetical protein
MNGWTCPKCEKVYAPDIKECAECNAKIKLDICKQTHIPGNLRQLFISTPCINQPCRAYRHYVGDIIPDPYEVTGFNGKY